MTEHAPYCSALWAGWTDAQCWYDWQGLTAGALAILAAVIGAWAIYRQTGNTTTLDRAEFVRRHNAARVVLPLALSSISELCREMAEVIADEYECHGQGELDRAFDAAIAGENSPSRFERLGAPEDAIQAFQNFVESLDRSTDIKHIAELLGSLQILFSRFNSFNRGGLAVRDGLISLLIDVAKVVLLNEAIFNYARFLSDESFGLVGTHPATDIWDQIHNKAVGLLFDRRAPEALLAPINDLIAARKNREASPWNEVFNDR